MFGYNPEDFLNGAIERPETTTVGDDRKNAGTTDLDESLILLYSVWEACLNIRTPKTGDSSDVGVV